MTLAVETEVQPREILSASPLTYDANAAEGVINGIAYTWGETAFGARGPTKFSRGAFTEMLAQPRPGRIPLLWQHHDDQVVGSVLKMEETERGLEFAGKLTLNTFGRDVQALLKDQAVSGVSLGFGALESKNAKEQDEAFRMVTRAYVHELSLVTFPAADKARVRDVHKAAVGELVRVLGGIEGLAEARLALLPDVLGGVLELPQREALEGKVFSLGNMTRLKDALAALVDLVSKVDPDHIIAVGQELAKTTKRSYLYDDPDEKKRKKMAETHARIRENEIRAFELLAMTLSAGNGDDGPKARLFDDIVAEQKDMEKQWRLQAALMDSIHSILSDEGVKDKPGMVKKTVAQFLAAAGE